MCIGVGPAGLLGRERGCVYWQYWCGGDYTAERSRTAGGERANERNATPSKGSRRTTRLGGHAPPRLLLLHVHTACTLAIRGAAYSCECAHAGGVERVLCWGEGEGSWAGRGLEAAWMEQQDQYPGNQPGSLLARATRLTLSSSGGSSQRGARALSLSLSPRCM